MLDADYECPGDWLEVLHYRRLQRKGYIDLVREVISNVYT